jgi:pimeloyl-ACP methyl ester carboxylesterase
MLFAACAADPGCARAFPDPAKELAEVLARAERGELRGTIPDPAGGAVVELPLSRGAVVTTLFGLLQSSGSAVRLPLLIHQVHEGDTTALVDALVAYRRGLDAGLGIGMYLSVMCSEDAPRMDPEQAAREDRDTALRDYRVAQLARACREWPRAKLPSGEPRPVRSDVPVLLVSGTLDPNTNERWGEEAARTLGSSTHVVIPNLSHAYSAIRACGATFITAFVEAASAKGLDFSCKDGVGLPPFTLPPAPDAPLPGG